MQTVFWAMKLFQLWDHGSRTYQRQVNVFGGTLVGIHEELNVLLCCHTADIPDRLAINIQVDT